MANTAISRRQKLIVIGGIIGALLLIFVGLRFVLNGGISGNTDSQDEITIKHTTITAVTEDAEDNLTNQDLKIINANIKANNLTILKALDDQRTSVSTDPIDETIQSGENSDELIEQLTDAAVDSRYDQEYVSIMVQLLQENLALIEDFGTSDSELAAILNQSSETNTLLLQDLQATQGS